MAWTKRECLLLWKDRLPTIQSSEEPHQKPPSRPSTCPWRIAVKGDDPASFWGFGLFLVFLGRLVALRLKKKSCLPLATMVNSWGKTQKHPDSTTTGYVRHFNFEASPTSGQKLQVPYLYAVLWGVDFPLHKPYPYSLHRFVSFCRFLHFRYLKWYQHNSTPHPWRN